MQVAFAKSGDVVRERQAVKLAAIADWVESEEYTVEFMCAELGDPRSGFYAWRGRPVSDRAVTDADLTALIRTIHLRLRGNPGVRRVRAEVATLGERASQKRVWRSKGSAGMNGCHPKGWKKTTLHGERKAVNVELSRRGSTAKAPSP